jgi:hypothetical protein
MPATRSARRIAEIRQIRVGAAAGSGFRLFGPRRVLTERDAPCVTSSSERNRFAFRQGNMIRQPLPMFARRGNRFA